MNLSNVEVGVKGRVVKVELTGKFKKRLGELGIEEGAIVTVTKRRKAFVIFFVLDTFYALRTKDAEKVLVSVCE